MPLDREAILDAAQELIDEDGLASFSLRALGRRLGVSQMAAYRHFEDKAAIIDALADRLLERIRLDDPDDDADPWELIVGYCRRARSELLSHPDLTPVVAARPLIRSSPTEDLIRLHGVFERAGFRDGQIVEAVFTIMSVTLGLVLYEQQRSAFDASQGDRYREQRAQTLDSLASLPDAPDTARALIASLADGTWGEHLFESVLTDVYESLLRRAAET